MTDTNTPLIRLIAITPMLRTMQLADRLDIPMDDIDTELRRHLVAGTVVEHEVDGPNNRKAMAYEVSEQFKLTDAYRVAVGAVGGTPAPAGAGVVARAASPEPAKATKALPAGAPMTKVERAIALVTVLGSVSDSDLHAELGLKERDYVASYIAAAVRDGRLVKTGKTWTLGTAAPAESEPAAAPQVTAAPAPAKPLALDVPRFIQAPVVEAAPKPAISAATSTQRAAAPIEQTQPAERFPGVDIDRAGAGAVAPTPGFRCAVWSDGVVHLERRGSITFELSPVEQDKLFAFLQRRA